MDDEASRLLSFEGVELATYQDLVARGDEELAAALLLGPTAVVDLVVSKATDQVHVDWASLFVGLSAQEAKRLAKEGRDQLMQSDSKSLTYGEVHYPRALPANRL